MMQRFLDPSVLASISSLDLVAKTVVDGFGNARPSPLPDLWLLSREFAEYRQYVEGDDLPPSSTFSGTSTPAPTAYTSNASKAETNSQLADPDRYQRLHVLPIRRGVSKLDYARYIAASLCYLASQQRDATGLIVFDDEVKNYVAPSTRQGQLMRLFHAVDLAGEHPHRFREAFSRSFQLYLHRRGIVVVLSDFYGDPATIASVIEPLRYHGNSKSSCSICSTPTSSNRKFRDPVLLLDVEGDTAMEVSPEYAWSEYRTKINHHMSELADKAAASGLEYVFMDCFRKPLDQALRSYVSIRQRRR